MLTRDQWNRALRRRMLQPPYHYGRSFATLPRYRCHAGESLQPMVISFRDQVRSFGEERGSYNTADAWQREEHLHIRRRL